jgi:hypothetical protein
LTRGILAFSFSKAPIIIQLSAQVELLLAITMIPSQASLKGTSFCAIQFFFIRTPWVRDNGTVYLGATFEFLFNPSTTTRA